MPGRATVSLAGRELAEDQATELAETARLELSVSGLVAPGCLLSVGGEAVPLVAGPGAGELVADPAWVELEATEHLVGDCLINLADAGGRPVWRATLRRRPTRITEDAYRWLLEELRRRGGPAGISDPYGRARIWESLGPDLPASEEERARIAAHLWERSAAALSSIAAAPVKVLSRAADWRPVGSLAGVAAGRVDGRRVRFSDPPRPLPNPTSGVVLVERSDEQVGTAENRFVLATVASLARLLMDCSEDSEVSPDAAEVCRVALAQLRRWFSPPPWCDLVPGPFPSHSFLIRDHPAYQSVAGLAVLLDDLPGAMARLPPLPRSLPLSPRSLNVLYERWVGVCALEWAEGRLGSLSPNRPALPAGGTYTWRRGELLVLARLDCAYPRHARPAGSASGPPAHSRVICPAGKNRPDLAIEVHRPRQRVRAATLDATYSRHPDLHLAKLEYARTLVDSGWPSGLNSGPARCVSWAAVAYPGRGVFVEERRADLGEAILSLPPGAGSEQLLHRWLDQTVGSVL